MERVNIRSFIGKEPCRINMIFRIHGLCMQLIQSKLKIPGSHTTEFISTFLLLIGLYNLVANHTHRTTLNA